MISTNSKQEHPVAENILNRDFTTQQLGHKWVSDITYIKVAQQWNYLTVILDLTDRKVVAWSLSKDMKVDNTTYKTWRKAVKNRPIKSNFIFHSDRRVQYAAEQFTTLFSFNRNATQSMSRKANCWDNAVIESFFKSIKYEWIRRCKYQNFKQAYLSIQQYMVQ